jgi:hypothetical protein
MRHNEDYVNLCAPAVEAHSEMSDRFRFLTAQFEPANLSNACGANGPGSRVAVDTAADQ